MSLKIIEYGQSIEHQSEVMNILNHHWREGGERLTVEQEEEAERELRRFERQK